MKLITHHWQLEVYKKSVQTAMDIFTASKHFPREEVHSLTGQMRRSSRAVSAIIAEAWRRRKYEAVFINKLNEAEAEAAETQTWIEYAVKCSYLDRATGERLFHVLDEIIAILVSMANHPRKWTLRRSAASLPLSPAPPLTH